MPSQTTIDKLTQKMNGAIEHLKKELASIRGSGRPCRSSIIFKVEYLWDADSLATGGESLDAGQPVDYDPALGPHNH